MVGNMMGGKHNKRGHAGIDSEYGNGYYYGNHVCGETGVSYLSSFSSCDKTMPRVDEIDDKISEKFDGYGVIILEKLRGVPVRIMTDGKTVKYGNRYSELRGDYESFGASKVLQKYKDIVLKIQKEIGVPICVYGEMIGYEINSDIAYRIDEKEKIVKFFDICLNDNWMNWDDFAEVTKKYDLPTVPFLGKISYNLEEFKKILNEFSTESEFGNQSMEGIIIRPLIEDNDYNKRLMAKLILNKFKVNTYTTSYPPSYSSPTPLVPAVVAAELPVAAKDDVPFPITPVAPKETPLDKSKAEAKSFIKESEQLMAEIHGTRIVDEFANDARVIYWRHELECALIEVKDENAIKIITTLTRNALNDLKTNIEDISIIQKINIDLLKTEIKKELPKRILKILNISIPTKTE